MNDLEKLVAAEAIRNANATYWFAMDTKDWERMASVFADDAIVDMRVEAAFANGVKLDPKSLPPVEQALAESDPAVVRGKIGEFIRGALANWVTVHQGGAPIIEITSSSTARAIWPLNDYIDDGKHSYKGYGHYHNEYRKVGERWLISRMSLTRLRIDGTHPWAQAR